MLQIAYSNPNLLIACAGSRILSDRPLIVMRRVTLAYAASQIERPSSRNPVGYRAAGRRLPALMPTKHEAAREQRADRAAAGQGSSRARSNPFIRSWKRASVRHRPSARGEVTTWGSSHRNIG